MTKMLEQEAIDVIKAYRKDAFGPESDELTADRAEALDRYHGRPYGDETDEDSGIVTKDLAEAVDWALPSVIRPFVQSGVLAEFKARDGKDQDQAELESAYVNHVILQENNGFILLHDSFKDAFILKNCYVKHWWDVEEKVIEREWEGMSNLEIAQIIVNFQQQGAKVEPVESEAQENGLLRVKLRITTEEAGVKIVPVPPEELRVSHKCRGSIQDADFIEHIPTKTRSDLIEMGMPKDWLMLQPAKGKTHTDTEEYARNTVGDEDQGSETGVSLDKAMEEMDYSEAYVRIDFDGDGVAELRKIIMVNDRIPPGDEWNELVDIIPFTGGTAKRMPHRHIGISFNDDIEDLASLSTDLYRQVIDNVTNTIHNQWAINGRVNEEDFLDVGAASVLRVKDDSPVGDSIMPIRAPSIVNEIQPLINDVNERLRKRHGVNEGDLDPDVLKQATKGAILEDLNRKSQQIEMVTRMLAETFVKELVIRVHELLIKHQTAKQSFKRGGEFTEVKPSLWLPRNAVSVKVGLGSGSRDERMQVANMLTQIQEKAAAAGIVSSMEIYNLSTDVARELGEDNPDKYFINPDPNNPRWQQRQQEIQQQQQQESGGQDLAAAEQVRGQYETQIAQMKEQNKSQLEQLKAQQKMQIEAMKMQQEFTAKERELQSKMALAIQELASKEDMAALDAEVKLMLAGIKQDIGRPGIGAGIQEKIFDPQSGALF